MSNEFVSPSIEWYELSPYLILLGGVLAFLIVGPLMRRASSSVYAGVTAVFAGAAGVVAIVQFMALSDLAPRTLVRGSLAHDRFGLLALATICLAVVLTSMTMADATGRDRSGNVATGGFNDSLEPYALMLTAALGGAIMVSANELIVTFLGIEILSLSLYVLAASDRRRRASQEAGLKYFILGGFASAFLLYGIALVYGATGQTSLDGIARVLSNEITLPRNDVMLLGGVALLLVGFSFKVALVPFHGWAPDVYHGAPTPITGFMASLGKVAALVAMLRLFVVAFPARADDWQPAVMTLAMATLVVGSVLAIVQSDAKRMLAYSSVSHAGFMLVGLDAAARNLGGTSNEGVTAALVYVVLYSVLAVGTFAAVSVVARNRQSVLVMAANDAAGTEVASAGDTGTSLAAFNGLVKTNPVFALGFTLLLLAQAGVPLTSGFVAKFGVVRAAVLTESYVLATLAMVTAVIAAYLYLRIIVSMWLSEPKEASRLQIGVAERTVLAVVVVITVMVGVLPSGILRLADTLTFFAR